jgi:peptidoglycan/LPS O-acetylase OafA/YrhL
MAPVVVRNTDRAEKRIPELDGVRAVAIWMVLLSHLFFAYDMPAGAIAWMPRTVRTTIAHGWLGVDLFFVLSGFLITGILLDSRENPKFFRNFYSRRALRILPVYLASVLVMSLLYVHGRAYLLLSSVFMANMAGLFAISIPHGPGVLWSLAVEEHFYVVWPWLVRFVRRRTVAVLALAIVLTTPLLRFIAAVHGVSVIGIIYQVSIFRFDGLALGALLAIWYRSSRYSRTRPLQVIVALLALDAALTIAIVPFGGMQSSSPLGIAFRSTQAQLFFAAGILAVLAYRGTKATAFLRSPVAVLSGELSYCIYLIHLALLDGYMAVGAPRIEPSLFRWEGPDFALAVRFMVVLGATFGVALLSRSYLERPFLRLKRRFG